MKHIIIASFLFFTSHISVTAQNVSSSKSPLADSSGEIKIFTKVEVEASFPGGEEGWRKYLIQNLNVDKVAKKIKIPRGEKEFRETIVVKFIVAKNGNISNVTAENGDANSYCVAEAIWVIKISPDWIPAQQNGRYVNAYRRQPITFLFER
jgi:protein TonB